MIKKGGVIVKQILRIGWVCAGLVAPMLFGSASLPKGGIIVTPARINLGTFYAGSLQSMRFCMFNPGPDTVHILNIDPSCGCSTVDSFKATLLPNEKDTFTVEFNSLGFRGHIEKSIQVTVDDKANPVIKASFFANVVTELEPVSRSDVIWLGELKLNTPEHSSFYLRNNSDRRIDIKKIESISGQLGIVPDGRSVLPEDSIRIDVVVTPKDVGLTSEEFIVYSSSPKQPSLRLILTYTATR